MSFVDDNVIKHCLVEIKRQLKQKGISYSSLAQTLNVSEVTVKRMLNQTDISLNRMLSLCAALEIDLPELLKKSSEKLPELACYTDQQDEAFFNYPHLFQYFGALMMADMSPEVVAERNNLDELSSYLYLRALENLELIKVEPGNKVRLVQGRKTFSPHSKFMKRGIAWCFAEAASSVLDPSLADELDFSLLFLRKEQCTELFEELRKIMLRLIDQQVDISLINMNNNDFYQFAVLGHPLKNGIPEFEIVRLQDGDLKI